MNKKLEIAEILKDHALYISIALALALLPGLLGFLCAKYFELSKWIFLTQLIFLIIGGLLSVPYFYYNIKTRKKIKQKQKNENTDALFIIRKEKIKDLYRLLNEMEELSNGKI